MAACVVAHRGIGGGGIHMGYLFRQLPRCLAHAVLHPIVFGDVALTAGAALWAKQLFQPLVTEHQHGIGIDHKPGLFTGHAPLLQFFWAQQMQKIFSAIALNALIGVGRAEQGTALGSAITSCCGTTDWMLSTF